ncbi:MAG: carbohydrate binding family 9 domain-containing protein, partial [Acidobacteria bacterium]|nr:carbohydrate binding family 9 domain-containing protein [Acidobacteriota bacterium]
MRLNSTSSSRHILSLIFLIVSTLSPLPLQALPDAAKARAQVHVPRLTAPPKIEDFLDMKPRGEIAQKMVKVEGFTQYIPHDGEPATQPTEVFLGYDDKNFYAVFLCFDSEPHKVRGRMARREKIFDDDFVVLDLDTFHDQRRSYQFQSNPLGVQSDNLWTEGSGNDYSWDTVWHSRGQMTDRGYVVWMAVPFKSMRFKPSEEQTWGIELWRSCPRINEDSSWPKISTRIEGELTQEADMHGLSNISPGRNFQLVPYVFGRSYRALDAQDPAGPRFVSKTFDPTAGLDAKIVLKDSFVLDVAVNPDFSQVESDEPQITLNRRFEVFFEEKRPFFLENADFFKTPMNLFFTRRIADPQFGVRLTGKKGPWGLGTLFADDEAPGKIAAPSDPLFGKRAKFGVLRLQRDILKQSNIGLIFTDRELGSSSNRVVGLDGRFRLTSSWVAEVQGVTSTTRFQ